ncbi:hypothetical protein NP233_g9558 [Leucocoprinus birnbaumii]|uniref:Uncharacterized protein n=1 Tax=Leucocoprinus birnbaumii TaxID=56174 RepID=A0AAD5VKD5_9AGAR|nr:hypothetical protein NP233_g9558 [Leucocoprinus birnbaumii]
MGVHLGTTDATIKLYNSNRYWQPNGWPLQGWATAPVINDNLVQASHFFVIVRGEFLALSLGLGGVRFWLPTSVRFATSPSWESVPEQGSSAVINPHRYRAGYYDSIRPLTAAACGDLGNCVMCTSRFLKICSGWAGQAAADCCCESLAGFCRGLWLTGSGLGLGLLGASTGSGDSLARLRYWATLGRHLWAGVLGGSGFSG